MDGLRFEWDSRKNQSNIQRHGIPFEEAQTAFMDDKGILIGDPDHSDTEDRFVLLGLSLRLRLVVVSHSYRQDDVVRIISARRANRRETSAYIQRWKP